MAKKNKNKHIRNIHEGGGQFSCDYLDCTYRSYDKRLLEVHAVKHTGENMFQCHLCDHTFSAEFYKKRHIKKVHDNEINLHIKMINTKEEMSKSAPDQNPLSKNKIPTEELQSENCVIDLDNPTVDKSSMTKSEMFGEISTHPRDKQLVKTSQNVQLSTNILREKLIEAKKGESWKNDDEPTLVTRLQRSTKTHCEMVIQPQKEIN